MFAAGFMVVMLVRRRAGSQRVRRRVPDPHRLVQSARWWTVVGTTGVIASVYLLWAYQRVFHGEPDDANRGFREIRPREAGVLGVIIAIIVFTGVAPEADARRRRAWRWRQR